MTNKTEMVSVPRELLERAMNLAKVFDDGSDGADAESAQGVVGILRAALAAPAEDVREVLDEPVGYSDEATIRWLTKTGFCQIQKDKPRSGVVVPLYRHAQRKVVMPDHRESDLRSPVYGYARGWNACLDEFERLNK